MHALIFSSICGVAALQFEGRVATRVEVDELMHGKVETEGKVEVKTKRDNGARVKIEVEAKSSARETILREARVDQNFDGSELTFGLAKKVLGLEYQMSDEERVPLRRTLLYRKIEKFSYVGRETLVRIHKGDDWSVTLGYSDALDADLITHAQADVGADWTVGFWGLLQSDKINRGRQIVWGTVFSAWRETAFQRIELELIAGRDPFESEYAMTLGDGDFKEFVGWKTLYAQRFGARESGQLEPYLGVSGVRHDIDVPYHHSTEVSTGLNWWMNESLMVGLGIDIVSTMSRLEPRERTLNDSQIGLEAKYVF